MWQISTHSFLKGSVIWRLSAWNRLAGGYTDRVSSLVLTGFLKGSAIWRLRVWNRLAGGYTDRVSTLVLTGFLKGSAIWRLRAWNRLAGVVKLQMNQLMSCNCCISKLSFSGGKWSESSLLICRKRSGRALECSGPWNRRKYRQV